MCLNCGCKRYADHMGDERNITTKELAEAAIANDMRAGQTMSNIQDALGHIPPDILEDKIKEVKEKKS